MICPKCRTENPDGVKFCGECGQSLQVGLTCPECGHVNPPDVKFCYECGRSLAEPARETTAVPILGASPSPGPTSFASGRYRLKKLVDESTLIKKSFIRGFLREIAAKDDEVRLLYTLTREGLDEERLGVLPIVRYGGR